MEAARRIYKYTIMDIKFDIIEQLLMPQGSKPLSVGWQDGVGVVMWVDVPVDSPEVSKQFYFLPTGGQPPSWKEAPNFIGTVQMPGGIVGHLWVCV